MFCSPEFRASLPSRVCEGHVDFVRALNGTPLYELVQPERMQVRRWEGKIPARAVDRNVSPDAPCARKRSA